MKYLDTYRNPDKARGFVEEIRRSMTRPWTVLEVCGGQAQNLLRFGTDRALPQDLELIHGPGCPVSATPAGLVDRAIAVAARPGVVVCAPGDLLRAPGTRGDTLQAAIGRGADVRPVYSPLDALGLARKHPDRRVVMLAVGFETTAPAAAAAILEAERLGLDNLSMLCAFFRLGAAVEAMVAAPGGRARAVLVAGPVCAVTGLRGYEPIAERFRVPVVVTGPEPADLLDALARAIRLLERGTYTVENQYARAVRPDGNPQARAAIDAVFAPAAAHWRGLGRLPNSGLALRAPYRRFDAAAVFPEAAAFAPSSTPLSECLDGEVLSGRIKPFSCPLFGTLCAPDHPLGAAMISAEGTCAAYYRHRRSPDGPSSPTPALTVMPAHSLRGS
jgi:hydrogenase expression/formation protein HypD